MNLDGIDYVKLYERLGVKILSVNTKGEAVALCPFHDDNKNSFAFNIENGLWSCFAGCGQGNIIHYIARKYDVCIEESEEILKTVLEPITEDVDKPHESLIGNKKVLDVFMQKRGLTLETIKKFKIGYDGDRFFIPITIGDVLMNIRKYSLEGGRAKMLNVMNYGNMRIFPYANLFIGDTVYLFEGEMDCILANQLGLNGITVTSGAGAFRSGWGPWFRDKTVVICYDIDKAGKRGAESVASEIKAFAKTIKIINLPISEPKNGDFTDYIVAFNHSVEDFLKLCDSVETQKAAPTTSDAQILTTEDVTETSLRESSNKNFYFKRVRMPVIVAGKDLTPFTVPKKIQAKCLSFTTNEKDIKTKCLSCPLARNNEEFFMIDETSQTVLNLIYSSDTQIKGYLRELAKIPKNCMKFKIEVVDTQNVEEIRLIPEVDYSANDSEYVARTAYYLGSHIKTNASYLIDGVSMPNPRNQYATIVCNKAEPKQTNIDVFKITHDIARRLKIFQPKEGQTVVSKLDEIYEDLTYNVTKIYQRQDLLTTIDMSFFSVLEFNFLKEFIGKGYVEVLIIGDTRCGKTKSIQSIVEHYKMGEFITGENTSFSGLVGGMSQIGNKWHITWGKLPLNDRRLVVVDETSSMAEETISNLSSIRSSGIAEIVKIQTEKTRARCRMIWLSNPRSGKRLNSYNHGILAVKELIGKVEDIARFDMAITVASTDVDLSGIQKEVNKNIEHVYTSELNNLLLLWTWSRKRDNVDFAQDTVDRIVEVTNELSELYSSAIPLVEAAEQRIKVARMSAAIAARLFSTDETFDKVVVKREHVDFVFEFLKVSYNKKSMAYNLYSQNQFSKTRMSVEKTKTIVEQFKIKFPERWDIMRDVLLENQYFRKTEFVDQTGMTDPEKKEFFSWATTNRLIRSTTGGYIKNPTFTDLLKSILDDERDLTAPSVDKAGDF